VSDVEVRETRPEDFSGIREMCREVYAKTIPWSDAQLDSHLQVFAEGQLVAAEPDSGRVVGMAASLVVSWDDYDVDQSWRDFTDAGFFTNHDPNGRTLYGAEVMVRPGLQGRGIGRRLYEVRRELCQRLGLLRIRAGARLRGYHALADRIGPVGYVRRVVRGEISDPTLSFQLRHDFRVIAVVSDYLRHDPESLGYAAVIEWLNPEVATAHDLERSATRFPMGDLPPWRDAQPPST